MLVVTRFRIPPAEGESFRAELDDVHARLASKPGYAGGQVGRNVDDPELWVLATTWADVGSYRRALGSYELKLHGVPVLMRAIDEPSAYESATPDDVLNVPASRGE